MPEDLPGNLMMPPRVSGIAEGNGIHGSEYDRPHRGEALERSG